MRHRLFIILLAFSSLLGCGVLPDGTGYIHPTRWHTSRGITCGEHISVTLVRLGTPMTDRHLNPKAPDSYYPSDIWKDNVFTGWCWWYVGHSTAVGIRYDFGYPVEYAYGANHWGDVPQIRGSGY